MDNTISGTTKLLCLLGNPARHSISPAMHSLAAQLLGLDIVYLAFEIAPDEIGVAVEGLKSLGALGFNLTMPFKESVIPYLDDLSPTAQLTRSVNTVKIGNERLYGDTTDGAGYFDSLKKEGFAPASREMVILGCGGAARSIIAHAAREEMDRIHIFQRAGKNFQSAVDFAETVQNATGCVLSVAELSDESALKQALCSASLLTNATPVGMGSSGESPVSKEVLSVCRTSGSCIISDIIYDPPQTPLLSCAKELGLPFVNGRYMLLYQGARAFQLWTGCEMPVEAVKHAAFWQ